MNNKQAQAETKYRLLVLLLLKLLEDKEITEEEFNKIRKAAINKFRPIIGWLELDE